MKLKVREKEANPIIESMSDRVRINFDIDEEMRVALKVRAAQEKRTINAILTELVRNYLNRA